MHRESSGAQLDASKRGHGDATSFVALAHGGLQGVVTREPSQQQPKHRVLILLRERADRSQEQLNSTLILAILVRYLSDIGQDTGPKVEV